MFRVIKERFAFTTADGRLHEYQKGDLIVDNPLLDHYAATGYLELVESEPKRAIGEPPNGDSTS